MKFSSYVGLLSFVSAAISDGTVSYLSRSRRFPVVEGDAGAWGYAFVELTFTAGVLTGWINSETPKGPLAASGSSDNKPIGDGTYDAAGTALTNPDAAKWTKATDTDNAFWSTGSG